MPKLRLYPDHPQPETLQYALITGRHNRKIWCLVHPDAKNALTRFKAARSWPGGRLGAAHFDPAELKVVRSTVRGHRVPMGLYGHPLWGDVVAKGSEADLHTPGPDNLDEKSARKALRNALWVSRTSIRCGIPTVPVHQAVTTDETLALLRKGTRGPVRGFWKHAGQTLTFQAFITEGREAAELLGCTLLSEDDLSETLSDWLGSLEVRLDLFESVSGAPDSGRHNSVRVPVLLPDGEMTDVQHGIDYDWTASPGFLRGDTYPLELHRENLRGDLPEWQRNAMLDVFSVMHTWERPPR